MVDLRQSAGDCQLAGRISHPSHVIARVLSGMSGADTAVEFRCVIKSARLPWRYPTLDFQCQRRPRYECPCPKSGLVHLVPRDRQRGLLSAAGSGEHSRPRPDRHGRKGFFLRGKARRDFLDFNPRAGGTGLSADECLPTRPLPNLQDHSDRPPAALAYCKKCGSKPGLGLPPTIGFSRSWRRIWAIGAPAMTAGAASIRAGLCCLPSGGIPPWRWLAPRAGAQPAADLWARAMVGRTFGPIGNSPSSSIPLGAAISR